MYGFTSSPFFVRFGSGPRGLPRRVARGPWWLLMAPGLGLVLLALAILIWPELLAYLVAGALLFVGMTLTLWGWSMRQAAKAMESRETRVYYEVH